MATARRLILFYTTMWDQLPGPESGSTSDFAVTTDRRRLGQAEVVVFHVPTLPRWWPLPRKRRGQLWVAWSMECELNYPRMHAPSFLRRVDLTMSYRLDADVPVPYLDLLGDTDSLVAAMRRPPAAKTADAPVASFVSSAIDKSGRRAYLAELARHVPLHSYGSFQRTHTLVHDRGRPTKLETIARYPFSIAFENARAPDYVTEKVYDPLVAGSIPIYFGAPNVERFVPGDGCYVDAAAFPQPRRLAEKLRALLHDAGEYASYMQWKERPFRPEFEHLLGLVSRSALERLCARLREIAPR